jgi:hypothetical protein
MVQRDYILREIEKIGAIISAFRQKIFGGSGNLAITLENQIENSKSMLLNEINFDLDKFLNLNNEDLNKYMSGFDGFNIENIELLADCLSQIGFDDNCDSSSKLYLEKSLQLYELCNVKSKSYSFEREAKMNELKIEFIKTRLSPCGLHCGKCFAFSEGKICRLSNDLKDNLGDFDVFAARFVDLLNEPLFLKYPEFKEMLNYFASGVCKGCRKEKCVLFKNCNVRECSENKQVDFCFQCPEFPCNDTGFDENLQNRWKLANTKMKEYGVEAYYNEIKDKPRY